jgi:hypothetical protein
VTVFDATLERPADRVAAQAQVLVRLVLSAVAWLLVGFGRAAYTVCAGVWLVLTWVAAAVRVGWDDGRQAQAARHSETGG